MEDVIGKLTPASAASLQKSVAQVESRICFERHLVSSGYRKYRAAR
jgi:hypothetical protein